MPKPRTPKAKAKATGAEIINPGRHKDRKPPKSRPLGEPASWMDGNQLVAWEAFKRELPWLEEADRTLVEVAASLRARLMDAPQEVGLTVLDKLRMCLGSMGATPADRSKVSVADDGDGEDPAEEYFQ